MDSPDWHAVLRARVDALQEPFRAFGIRQCEEALNTFRAFPAHGMVISWELAEIVESLEYSDSQILAMSHGHRREALAQAGWWLYI